MPDAKKIVLYVLPDKGLNRQPGHPFLVGRRTEKNDKGRYVTREEFLKVGLLWPTNYAANRQDLARRIGEALLDEAGV